MQLKHHPECLKEIKKLKKKVWQIQCKLNKLDNKKNSALPKESEVI